MAYKPINIPQEPEEPINELIFPEINGGLNLRDIEQNMQLNQTRQAKNVWFQERVFSKRFGQEESLNLGSGIIYAIHEGLTFDTIFVHVGTTILEIKKSQL